MTAIRTQSLLERKGKRPRHVSLRLAASLQLNLRSRQYRRRVRLTSVVTIFAPTKTISVMRWPPLAAVRIFAVFHSTHASCMCADVSVACVFHAIAKKKSQSGKEDFQRRRCRWRLAADWNIWTARAM
jgi:hypothetical protein